MLKDLLLWLIRSQAYKNIVVIFIIAGFIYLIWLASRREYWRSAWRQVCYRKLAMVCLVILSMYVIVGFLDSISWSNFVYDNNGKIIRDSNGNMIYESRPLSILDRICTSLREKTEKTYSAPFSTRLFSKQNIIDNDGRIIRDYPRLIYGGAHLKQESESFSDIILQGIIGLFIGLPAGLIVSGILVKFSKLGIGNAIFWGIISLAMVFIIASVVLLARNYHVLGTDKVGNDILYRVLKGIRTALIIGGFTTILAVPFAIFFGVLAGYFGKRVDDIIQYIYTTLASIPSILLIVAFMLIFGRGLFNLCLIMGITSWTGLCRLLRGETLKLRELEYVQAARAFGVSHTKIILRHIIPNVMHLVLISFLLRFSGLVLAEAMLSYLQIGVEPTRGSWGSMIDIARMELAREPVVWWNLSAAFVFMVLLVLSANLFGDAVRDALDPRLRTK